MYNYSDLEKNILKHIYALKYDDANALKALERVALIDKVLEINFEKQELGLYVPFNKEERQRLVHKFLESVVFIEYLLKNGFIYIHKNAEEPPYDKVAFSCLSQDEVNNLKTKYGIEHINTDLYDKVVGYGTSYIIVTQRLKNLVDSDFKSEDRLYLEKTLFWARFTWFITFLALVISLYAVFKSALGA